MASRTVSVPWVITLLQVLCKSLLASVVANSERRPSAVIYMYMNVTLACECMNMQSMFHLLTLVTASGSPTPRLGLQSV